MRPLSFNAIINAPILIVLNFQRNRRLKIMLKQDKRLWNLCERCTYEERLVKAGNREMIHSLKRTQKAIDELKEEMGNRLGEIMVLEERIGELV